jgi:hypothetical protein
MAHNPYQSPQSVVADPVHGPDLASRGALLDSDKRCLHDLEAGTQVINAR